MSLTAGIVLILSGSVGGAEPPAQDARELRAPELGDVRWQRDLDVAFIESGNTHKPVLVLFQEVPGCATCVDFGHGALSHPLLVEAMETEFIPVLVYNNRDGRDAALVKQFDEPAWNYPVMRFLDADGEDLIERKDGIWSEAGIAKRMVEALRAADRTPPGYLKLTAVEMNDAPHQQATFAMHCYWDGEAALGRLPGVVTTRAGWLEGLEVVEVTFNPAELTYERLLTQAVEVECADRIFAHDDSSLAIARRVAGDRAVKRSAPARQAKASDQKYTLRNINLWYVPLTPMQATKVNAAIRLRESPYVWLSPNQIALATRLRHMNDVEITLSPPTSLAAWPEYLRQLELVLDQASQH